MKLSRQLPTMLSSTEFISLSVASSWYAWAYSLVAGADRAGVQPGLVRYRPAAARVRIVAPVALPARLGDRVRHLDHVLVADVHVQLVRVGGRPGKVMLGVTAPPAQLLQALLHVLQPRFFAVVVLHERAPDRLQPIVRRVVALHLALAAAVHVAVRFRPVAVGEGRLLGGGRNHHVAEPDVPPVVGVVRDAARHTDDEHVPSSRVVVLPAAVIASRVLPTDGSFVLTIRCAPMLPSVYTFDSPVKDWMETVSWTGGEHGDLSVLQAANEHEARANEQDVLRRHEDYPVRPEHKESPVGYQHVMVLPTVVYRTNVSLFSSMASTASFSQYCAVMMAMVGCLFDAIVGICLTILMAWSSCIFSGVSGTTSNCSSSNDTGKVE
uniref:Uncharacterized protein n=1 Tax=Anopheles merus TaxID=30066 RepID=A0A182VBT0_ANOME